MKPSTYELQFTKIAIKSIKKLGKPTQIRIKAKLTWLMQQGDPLKFSEPLIDSKIGGYRFRIGDYRVIFDVEGKLIIAHLVGHRKEIYKK